MFSFVGGPYTDNITTITAATMNYLRGILANAWDIIGGGTYTPTTQTELTGTIGLKTNFSATGLQVAGLGGLHILSGSTGYVDSGGFLTVSSGGVATITGTMTTSGAGAITIANGGDLFIASGGEETVQSGGLLTAAAGSTVTLAGTSTVSGAMTVNATGTLTTNAASTSTFAGPITSTGGVSLTGTLSGTITQTAATTLSGATATVARRQTTIAVGAITPTVDVSYDEWLILGTNPATTMVVTLRSTTAPIPVAGQSLKLGRLAVGSGNVSVRREDGSILVSLDNATRSGIEVSYWPSDGGWLLMGGYEYTLGASP